MFMSGVGSSTYWYGALNVSVDIRTAKIVVGRSINLALSTRGLAALDAVGLKDEVLQKVIPMYGRMIHERDGQRWEYPYGTAGQVSRDTQTARLVR